MAIESNGDAVERPAGTRFASEGVTPDTGGVGTSRGGSHFKENVAETDGKPDAQPRHIAVDTDTDETDGGVVSVGSVSLAEMSSVPVIPPADGQIAPSDSGIIDIPTEIEMAAYDKSQVAAERRDEKKKEHVIDKYRNGTRFMEYTKSALILLLVMNTFAKMTGAMSILVSGGDPEPIAGIAFRLAVTYIMYAIVMKLVQVLMAKRLKNNFDALTIEEQNVIRYEYARDNAHLTNDHVVDSIKKSLLILPVALVICSCMWLVSPGLFAKAVVALCAVQLVLFMCVLFQGRGHVNIDDGSHKLLIGKGPKLRRGKMKLNPMDAIDTELESVMPKETVAAAHKVAEAVSDENTGTVVIPDVLGSAAIAEAISGDDTNVVIVKEEAVDAVETEIGNTDDEKKVDEIIDKVVADMKKENEPDDSDDDDDEKKPAVSKRIGKYVNKRLQNILLAISYLTVAFTGFVAGGSYFTANRVLDYDVLVYSILAFAVSIVIASISAFIYRRCGRDYAHAPLFFLVYGLSNGFGVLVGGVLLTAMCFGYPITATFAMFVVSFAVATVWNETNRHIGLDMDRPTTDEIKAELGIDDEDEAEDDGKAE